MPAGVSWGRYLSFTAAATVSMFAGSQVVHTYYRPLDDLPQYVKTEIEKKHVNVSVDEVLHPHHSSVINDKLSKSLK